MKSRKEEDILERLIRENGDADLFGGGPFSSTSPSVAYERAETEGGTLIKTVTCMILEENIAVEPATRDTISND